jgi:hypothetical protein
VHSVFVYCLVINFLVELSFNVNIMLYRSRCLNNCKEVTLRIDGFLDFLHHPVF